MSTLKADFRQAYTRARMHGKGFCNPVGKRYPEGRYLGGKNLVWFTCVGLGRAGRLFLDDGTPFGVSLLLEPLRMRVR